MQPGRSLDITLPLSIRAADEPGFLAERDSSTSMPLVVRLKPVRLRPAQAVVKAAFREHLAEHQIRGFGGMPAGEERSAVLLPAAKEHDRLRTDYSTPLRVLLGMVGLVRLVSCVTSPFPLVRATACAIEIAVPIRSARAADASSGSSSGEPFLFSLIGGALDCWAGWSTWFIA